MLKQQAATRYAYNHVTKNYTVFYHSEPRLYSEEPIPIIPATRFQLKFSRLYFNIIYRDPTSPSNQNPTEENTSRLFYFLCILPSINPIFPGPRDIKPPINIINNPPCLIKMQGNHNTFHCSIVSESTLDVRESPAETSMDVNSRCVYHYSAIHRPLLKSVKDKPHLLGTGPGDSNFNLVFLHVCWSLFFWYIGHPHCLVWETRKQTFPINNSRWFCCLQPSSWSKTHRQCKRCRWSATA